MYIGLYINHTYYTMINCIKLKRKMNKIMLNNIKDKYKKKKFWYNSVYNL